jgi:hypothetical protein
MSTKETINPAEAPQVELSKSLGIKKIEGKEFFITGINHTRGKPTQYTKKEDIGEDGKTDYYTIKVEKGFPLVYKDEGEVTIDNFFVNSIVYQQVERIPNAIEGLESGARFGPCKTVLRKSNKPNGYDYRCLAFESDPDF